MNGKCDFCGNQLSTGDMDNVCTSCKLLHKYNPSNNLTGWVCPVCGRGNSPYTSTCPCIPIMRDITC